MRAFSISYPNDLASARAELGELADEGKFAVIAGGQDLLGEMKDGLSVPDHLVSLTSIEELGYLRVGGERQDSVIGSTVTLARIAEDPAVGERLPMLAEAAASIGTPQIRNLGTLGGNLCQRPRCVYYRNEATVCLKRGGSTCFAYSGLNKHNAILGGGPNYIIHPSDLAPALVAYDATVKIAVPGADEQDSRTVPIRRFFTLPSKGDATRENVLQPGEVITAVSIPDRAAWRATYLKVKERHSFDFALSSVALALRMAGDKIAEARVVLGAVAPTPWRCRNIEQFLMGRKIDDETIGRAREDAFRGAKPLSQNAYKIPMTQGLLTKAFRKLASWE